jgi:LmbE family N-acetylglucosaminyl deacetylase
MSNLPASDNFTLTATDRLLVIAPHPDDESLAVGGIIWQARQLNLPVSIIFLTNGDGNRVGVAQYAGTPLPKARHYQAYGALRQDEALRALRHLDIHKQDVHFLGLPDQGLTALLKPEHRTTPHTSRYTKVAHNPYLLSYAQRLPYTFTAATKAIQHLVALTKPTIILLPILEDTHSDHRAASQLLLHAIPQRSAKLYAYPVHYKLFPKPRGLDTDLPLHIPKHHPRKDWIVVPLPEAARMAKHLAVESYQTQLKVPLLAKLMFSLVRSNELLLPL